jgi:hypothetical protein
MTESDRDVLGRIVRAAWEAEARTWADAAEHPNWTTPYDDLPERDREVDRLIGEAVAAHLGASCPACDGCGQVADSDDREPWTVWASLPPGSDLAVRAGMVRPMPCPRCAGSGLRLAREARWLTRASG